MTAPHSISSGTNSLRQLAEELREYTAMKYAGDCKCGKCQLVPRELVERLYRTLNSTRTPVLPSGEVEDANWNIRKYVDFLRADEGNSITLLCDNPDFNGQPNCAIRCNGYWTNWQDRRFAADTIESALQLAYFECRRWRENPPPEVSPDPLPASSPTPQIVGDVREKIARIIDINGFIWTYDEPIAIKARERAFATADRVIAALSPQARTNDKP